MRPALAEVGERRVLDGVDGACVKDRGVAHQVVVVHGAAEHAERNFGGACRVPGSGAWVSG